MKTLTRFVQVAIVLIFMVSPTLGQEKPTSQALKQMKEEVKKPSLTFYYFDG